jgi:eukaryotic-like serine/threonine-protein kinase
MPPTDVGTPSVEELLAGERLREAAARCQAEGDVGRAIELLEQAAAFEDAARLAIEQGQAQRALRLAAMAGSDGLLDEAARGLGREEASRLGADLASRGQHRAAAHAYVTAGAPLSAAEAWERAAEAVRAAAQYREGGDAIRAARVLTVRLEERPDDPKAGLLLGRILVENGRFEAAASALQRVLEAAPTHRDRGPDPRERRAARALLALALDRLGLHEARASLGQVDAITELDDLARGGKAASASAAPLLFGRYEVEEAVATTPTARVVRALDRLTGAHVAVKLFRPGAGGQEGRDAVGRFAREARALALLRHPHVLPLLAFVPEGPAVVLPWMPGGTFADLRLAGGVAPARAVEIALAVLGALGEAHRIGVLHRDVKPSNILLDAAGAPYLADFGAAHVGDAAATVTAGLIGSLAYMAPEQLAAQPAAIASDLYAVGAVLYEALTGECAAPADQLEVLPSEVNPDLTRRHDEVVGAMLARDPAARPESAVAAAAALRELSWRTDAPARPRRPPESGPGSVRPQARRLQPLDGGAAWDTLLARRVRVFQADPPRLALARAFARASAGEAGRRLSAVFRVDAQARTVWVEDPPGHALAVLARPLRDDERSDLALALSALHREGAVHGHVDRDHVRIDATRGAVLLFPDEGAPEATADDDRACLSRL